MGKSLVHINYRASIVTYLKLQGNMTVVFERGEALFIGLPKTLTKFYFFAVLKIYL